MMHIATGVIVGLSLVTSLASAGQGPAGASGPCANVSGPVDTSGHPIGFTCENVGGAALLVWNASNLSSNVSITGGTRAVNFYPGDFTIDGTFKSDGSLAFVAGTITVKGIIMATDVLIAGARVPLAQLKTDLLGSAGRITSTSTAPVIIDKAGKITATTGNVVIAGQNITNRGNLTANYKASLTTGSTLDIGWADTTWIAGLTTASNNFTINNHGTITADKIRLEAQRARTGIGAGSTSSIFNSGTLSAKGTERSITLVTGKPGVADAAGTYSTGTFGVTNNGKMGAATITLSPYYKAVPGELPKDRTFTISDKAQTEELKQMVGGSISETITDNPHPPPPSAVIEPPPTNITPTSSLAIPQLAASMSHLNATQQPKVNTLAVSSTNEPLRGDGKPAASATSKPRPKAKPVLVRGAFFGSKISATITSR